MIRVGVAGWSYADWKGRVYPRTSDKSFHPLEYLANFFGCIEINSSFYALPKIEFVREWARRVAAFPDFRFAVKLHRDFTHGRFDGQQATSFHRTLAPLEEAGKLGAVLAQFHQDFADGPSQRAQLLRIAELFGNLPLVLELRHRSWFQNSTLDFLESEHFNLAHIDMPPSATVVPRVKARDKLPYFVGPLGYLRLHGRNTANWYDPEKGRDDKYDWMYSREDAAVFADYARHLSQAGGDTYVVTNNHFAGKAVVNGLELLSELTAGPVSGPAEIVATYPQLGDIVIPRGQGTLF